MASLRATISTLPRSRIWTRPGRCMTVAIVPQPTTPTRIGFTRDLLARVDEASLALPRDFQLADLSAGDVHRLGLERVQRPAPVLILEKRQVGRRQPRGVDQDDLTRDRSISRPRGDDTLRHDDLFVLGPDPKR